MTIILTARSSRSCRRMVERDPHRKPAEGTAARRVWRAGAMMMMMMVVVVVLLLLFLLLLLLLLAAAAVVVVVVVVVVEVEVEVAAAAMFCCPWGGGLGNAQLKLQIQAVQFTGRPPNSEL